MQYEQVISISLLVCTLLFVVTAICGYLYYGQNVDPDLLKDLFKYYYINSNYAFLAQELGDTDLPAERQKLG